MKKTFLAMMVAGLVLWAALAMGAEQEPGQSALEVTGLDPTAPVTYQILEDGKLLISVNDAQEKPIQGLTQDYFTIWQGSKKAKILTFEPLATNKEIGLDIVMVVDNSKSMQIRQAVQPLSAALEAFYKTLRPIDSVTAVMFDERGTMAVNGTSLHAKVLRTSDVEKLRAFVTGNLDAGLTEGTYLYDAMAVGLDLVRAMPAKSNKFMVVFSDGEDINSVVQQPDLDNAAQNIPNFSAYAVDYMPSATTDSFLQAFAASHHGRIWKAASAAELLPVFEAFSSILLHRYVVTYRFNLPPQGSLAFGALQLTIEEITTIDSGPLLNQIYFDTTQSELPNRYVLFADQKQASVFMEKDLKGGVEKYRQVLNILGARMQAHPEAAIRLVGCNSNTGEEKGRSDLSRSRAESVKAYFRYVWGIDPSRLTVEQRNLPMAASTSRIPEGRAENQRVEIHSEHPAILDTINSEYTQKVSDLKQLRIVPTIQSEAGIADWQVALVCGDKEVKSFSGQGAIPAEFNLPLEESVLDQIAACPDVHATIRAVDAEANALQGEEAAILPIRFIQRKEQMSQVQGYKVKEQYALILFDFDSTVIKERNQVIVQRIIQRLRKIANPQVAIVGHTDTIGKEAYNIALSQRRAEAVKQALLDAEAPLSNEVLVMGAGPNDPLYDNGLPEGRALNRTVTITLEYMQQEGQN